MTNYVYTKKVETILPQEEERPKGRRQAMDQRILKKGRIDSVDGTRITIFSYEGQCKDIFAVIPEDAESIREDIGRGTKVFYVVEGNRLLGIGPEGICLG